MVIMVVAAAFFATVGVGLATGWFYPGRWRQPVSSHSPRRVPWRKYLRRHHHQQDAAVVAELAHRLAVVLQAGVPVGRAWHVAAEFPDSRSPRVANSLRAAGAVPDAGGSCSQLAAAIATELDSRADSSAAIMSVAQQVSPQQHAALQWLAVTLSAAEYSGAPIASALQQLAEVLRDEDRARAALREAMAAPNATIRILTLLPVAGLMMSLALGSDVLAILVSHPIGRLSAVMGISFWVTGYWWLRRLRLRAQVS